MEQKKIEELAFRVIGDMGGSFVMALGYIGDRLGLFAALSNSDGLTSQELADKTELNERYVREWAKAMVAAEYIDYHQEDERFSMTEEQVFVLANDDSPMSVGGALQFTTPSMYNVPKIVTAFKEGGGVCYNEIGDEIPLGIERFFRPGYVHFLAKDWIGALDGMSARLEHGARVADIGCGRGQSTLALARGFPKSHVVGVDNHAESIAHARNLATAEGLENVEFVECSADELAETKRFDLICSFDCIHDMVNPAGTLSTIRELLADDGIYFWSEPNGSEKPHENRNILGRLFASISPLHCMTVSLCHKGEGLGTLIGETGARALADSAGFSSFEKVDIDNPFNQFFALKR